jgi:host cell factor
VIVFGGHYLAGEGLFEYVNETWVFDIDKVCWQLIKCTGELPTPRYGHSTQVVGSRMFIFGGKGKNGILRDVMFLDLVEWIWVPVSALQQGPSARMNHASSLVGRKIVIHGGWDGEETFNDLWIFNTDSFGWMQPRTSGFAPSSRFGHTMNLTEDGRLLCFGGCSISKDSGSPRYNDDLRELDTGSMIWSRPRVHGDAPTGRYGHTAMLMGPTSNQLVVVGGWGAGGCQTNEAINNPKAFSMHIFNVATMTWSIPQKHGKKPLKHLYNFGSCANDTGDYMFIYGGYDGRQASSDNLFINVLLDV